MLLDELLEVLGDPEVPDEAVGGLLRGRIGISTAASAMVVNSIG